ncbi:MAG: hypothetical protein H0W88_11895 [Parachlamydiaceae bacterium]|nr:hypothetical protein [Parachlamydiaceae bacterium]
MDTSSLDQSEGSSSNQDVPDEPPIEIGSDIFDDQNSPTYYFEKAFQVNVAKMLSKIFS